MIATRISIRSILALTVIVLVAVLASGADTVTIELETDVGVTVFINGKLSGVAEAFDTLEFEVSPGQPHELWVMGTQAPGVGQRFIVDISYGSEVLGVELGDQVEEWVEDDPDDRASAPWEGSLVDRLDGSLLDSATDLVWTRRDNGSNIDWEQAAEYCEGLEPVDDQTWRLPTMEELEPLVDEGRDDYVTEFMAIRPFHLTGCCVWSTEEYGNISAWYMGFDAGERGFVTRDYAEGGRALCVRDASMDGEDDD